MPFKRQQYIDEISYRLSHLRLELKDHNQIGLYDSNVMAENFYCNFLNYLHGWELINANNISKNHPGIDLIDEKRHIVVQVSASATAEKIQHSIDTFLNYYTGDIQYHFYMLVLTEKQKSYKKEFDTQNRLLFLPKTDIWDTSDLLQSVKNLPSDSLDKLEQLYLYLDQELGFINKERLRIQKTGNCFSQQEKINTKEPYVFVSYAHKDREQVYQVLRELREMGMRYWFDDYLEHGDDYEENLQEAIDASTGVLVFVSPNINESDWCPSEIKYSMNHKKGFVYPIYLKETTLKHGLGIRFESLHAIYLNQGKNSKDIYENLKQHIPQVFTEKKTTETDTTIENTSQYLSVKKRWSKRWIICALFLLIVGLCSFTEYYAIYLPKKKLNDIQPNMVYSLNEYADIFISTIHSKKAFYQFESGHAGDTSYYLTKEADNVLTGITDDGEECYFNHIFTLNTLASSTFFLGADLVLTNKSREAIDFTNNIDVEVIYDNDYCFSGWIRQLKEVNDYDLINCAFNNITDVKYNLESITNIALDPSDTFPVNVNETGHYLVGCTLPSYFMPSQNSEVSFSLVLTINGQEIIYHLQ